MSSLVTLILDILKSIFDLLNFRDQVRLRSTCKLFNEKLLLTYIPEKFFDYFMIKFSNKICHLSTLKIESNLEIIKLSSFNSLTKLEINCGVKVRDLELPISLKDLYIIGIFPCKLAHLTNLTTLTLYYMRNVLLPVNLKYLKTTSLDIELSHLTQLKHLVVINASQNFNRLRQLTSLTALEIYKSGKNQTLDLSAFKNLEYLCVIKNLTIKGISNLNNLKTLKLTRDVKCDDIETMDLSNIKCLELPMNESVNIDRIKHIPSLTLAYNYMFDSKQLTPLINITILTIDITRSIGLDNFNLEFNALVNIEKFTFQCLRLFVNDTNKRHIDIRGCKKLKSVEVTGVWLLGSLSLPNITFLKADYLTDENLSELYSLNELHISDNTHVTKLAHLTNLTRLTIGRSTVTEENLFVGLTSLRYLNIGCVAVKYNMISLFNPEDLVLELCSYDMSEIATKFTKLRNLYIEIGSPKTFYNKLPHLETFIIV